MVLKAQFCRKTADLACNDKDEWWHAGISRQNLPVPLKLEKEEI